MRYYYVEGTERDAHVIAAESEDGAMQIAVRAGMNVTVIYELTSKTYQAEGFIV